MGIRQRFVLGAAVAGVCLVLTACGGGGTKRDGPTYEELQAELNATKEMLTKAEADLRQAQADLRQAETDEQATANELQQTQRRLTQLQIDYQEALNEVQRLQIALQQAQADTQNAVEEAEEAQEQAQSLEANQRAKSLLAAFPVIGDPPAAPTGDSPVTMTVPSRGSLRFEQVGRSVSSISTPGLSGERGARLTRTRGGTDTTVVYTDRELSRKLLDHYASFKETADATQIQINATSPTPPAALAVTTSENIIERTDLNVSHGFSGSIAASATERTPTKERASFSGSLHGIPGQFLCEGEGCMITLSSTYNAADADPDPNKLSTVTMEVSGGHTLHFKPSNASASVTLGPLGIQGRVGDDERYMTFGWWGHEPTHVNGTYTFGVFSDVEGGGQDIAAAVTAGATGTADYDGTAVGLYVDQDATTARQGEFTAEVRLTADFGASSLSGEIDNFKTTPRGGSVAPALSNGWVVVLANGGGATIRRTGSTSSGAWAYEFVPKHTHARADAKPPAVTGTFNTEIANLLQIVGAFGAELQE